MRSRWLIGLVGISTLLTGLLVVLAGCGGPGRPLQIPGGGATPSPAQQFLDLLSQAQRAATYVEVPGPDAKRSPCARCHDGDDPNSSVVAPTAPKHSFAAYNATNHARVAQFGCEQCHGPGSVHVANPTKENILSFSNIARSTVCAQCHGPKSGAFDTSAHADIVEAVVEGVGTSPDTYARTCARCHSSPFRLQYIDSKMARGATATEVHDFIQNTTLLPSSELTKFSATTHQTASCVNCHEPHKLTGKPAGDGAERQLRRKTVNNDITDVAPGASNRTHTTFDHICASCHNGRGGNPANLTGTSRPNFHDSNQYNMYMGFGGVDGIAGPPNPVGSHPHAANAPGQCTKCHMPGGNHSMVNNLAQSCTIAVGGGGTGCHSVQDAEIRFATRGAIELLLFSLRSKLATWAQNTFRNPAFWDYQALIPATQNPPANLQAQIPNEIRQARHNYYFVLRDRSLGIHNPPYARHLINVANSLVDPLIGRSAKPPIPSPQEIRRILQEDLRRASRAELHY